MGTTTFHYWYRTTPLTTATVTDTEYLLEQEGTTPSVSIVCVVVVGASETITEDHGGIVRLDQI